MSILIHAIIAVTYSVLALAAALMLPEALPQVTQQYATVGAAAVMLVGAVTQFSLTLRGRRRQLDYRSGSASDLLAQSISSGSSARALASAVPSESGWSWCVHRRAGK